VLTHKDRAGLFAARPRVERLQFLVWNTLVQMFTGPAIISFWNFLKNQYPCCEQLFFSRGLDHERDPGNRLLRVLRPALKMAGRSS
jgi:hypothetical protein